MFYRYDSEGRPRSNKDLLKFFKRLHNPNFMPEPEGEFVNAMRWGKEDVKTELDNGNVIFLESEHW